MSKELAYQKMAITSGKVSCGICNKAIEVKDCIERESKLDNEFFKYRLELICNICNNVVAGADV